MRRIAARAGTLASLPLIVLASVGCSLLGGNVASLAVGDCFDPPNTVEVEDVKRHPCTDPHGGEVFFVTDYAPSEGPLPDEADFRDFLGDRCPAAFEAYTGIDWASDTTYDIGTLWPSQDSWNGGDREMTCYVVRVDGAALTQSLRKA